jgi:hypothetical protein
MGGSAEGTRPFEPCRSDEAALWRVLDNSSASVNGADADLSVCCVAALDPAFSQAGAIGVDLRSGTRVGEATTGSSLYALAVDTQTG